MVEDDSGYGGSGWGSGPWGNGGAPLAGGGGPGPGPAIDYISARGTTPWVQLPNWPRGIVVGDVLELYEEHYNEVSREFTIVGLEKSLRVIKISPEIESDADFQFTDGTTPPPFARIRVQRTYDFNKLKARATTWLARPENAPEYLSEADRQMNALIINRNPTAQQVRDFGISLEKLAAWLSRAGQAAYGLETTPAATLEDTLEQALLEYRVEPPVQEIDTLLASYRERGADRAVNVLLECRFQDFFGVSPDTASYAGNLMEQLRELAREQLPVSKYDRAPAGRQELLSSSPAQDPEYTLEALDQELSIDPPTDG